MTTEQQPQKPAPHYKDVPPGKKIAVTLLWGIFEGDVEHCYRVTAISNTTWYRPGDKLSVEYAQDICNMPGWEVTMVGEDIVAAITNMSSAATGASGALNLAKGLVL